MNFIDKKINEAFETENFKKIIFGVIIFIIAIVMYGFNRHTPLLADDLGIAVYIRDHDFSGNVSGLFAYYMLYGGRIVVHIISAFFLSMDKSFFNIANTLAYVIFNLLMLFHGLGKNFYSPFALIFINLILFLFTPAFGQDFLWLDGASNYLWGIIIVLAFFIPYRLQAESIDNIFNRDKILTAPFFLAGIIAAWTNENMSLTLISMIFICIYFIKKKTGHIFKWQIAGGVGAIVGALLLLLAPGNFNRMAQEDGGQHVEVVKNFFDISHLFIDPHFLLFPIFFIILFATLASDKGFKNTYIIYLTGFLISMYAMIGAPYYTDRAKLGSIALAIILILYFYGYIKYNTAVSRRVVLVTGIFLIFLFQSEWRTANEDIRAYHKIEKSRIEQIERERDTKDEIILDDNLPRSRYVAAWGLYKLEKDSNVSLNKWYADFYNIKSVRIK